MSHITIAVVWSDPDLLEIEAAVSFRGWSGSQRAYVTRGELLEFARQLDEGERGGTEAVLKGGQPDLGYAELDVYEYGKARRTAVRTVLGHGNAFHGNDWPHGGAELRVAVPVERGSFGDAANGLRAMVAAEKGAVRLPVLAGWP